MYKAELVSGTRELSKREAIRIKDYSSFQKLKDMADNSIIEKVTGLFVVHVENDKSDSGEYDAFVIEQSGGENYIHTASVPFHDSLNDILSEFIDETGYPTEQVDIQVKRFPSKNNSGSISKAVLV